MKKNLCDLQHIDNSDVQWTAFKYLIVHLREESEFY